MDKVMGSDTQAAAGTPGRIGGGTGRRPLRRIAALAAVPAALCAVAVFQAPAANAATGYIGNNYLRNWETGRCLDSNAGGSVYTLPCNLPVKSNKNQLWEPQRLGHAFFSDIVLVRNVGTDRCLTMDRSRSGVHTEPCNSSDYYQQWEASGSGWENISLEKRFAGADSLYALDSNRQGGAYAREFNGGGFQHWKFGF
ncbi:ricin-type beta-trefoil lectin domain protein [Streptomyces sp. RKAG293]|uniref:RICIN domain-containing protein n=1 Tax=Streptomyces sp. RKAG293 TaxID=2893403 RepID=UPI0020342C27|nr:ricin-type beta-trefoil lectin domain protein [Streptomyces sp. RKAG293]MCM2422647.1 RICIN domain-containing protein [Streptomyces sp. RKAG293]